MIEHSETLYDLLESRVARYNTPYFIEGDPISIPHRFSKPIDIEITAFWTAMLSWGQRTTIINKATELFALMDNAPGDFILNHSEKDLRRFERFVHRTFQPVDALYFIHFFRRHYGTRTSLEDAFLTGQAGEEADTRDALAGFHHYFFDSEWAPKRTRKHVSTPGSGSSCKRLNMFLRWMVRSDGNGVDFGLWKRLSPSQLYIPLDVHVHRVATRLGLLDRKQADWKATEELTQRLREFDPDDPVKYDYALFGMGVLEKSGAYNI